MAKCKAVEWLTEKKLLFLRGWGRDGLTDSEIANKMRISRPTFYDWIKKYPEIKEAIESGREVANYKAEESLFKRVLGYDVYVPKHFKVKKTEYGPNGKKKSEKEEVVEVQEKIHIPADVTAIIYYLKCRKKDKWNDKNINTENIDIEDLTPLAKMLGFDENNKHN